jgi:hypothetical protein
MKQPNEALRRARERTPSPSHPEECLSRQELAELVNTYVWEHHQIRVETDANYIGKLERGRIGWPGMQYRQALRHLLAAPSDAALGLINRRRTVVRLPAADRAPLLRGGVTGVGGRSCGQPRPGPDSERRVVLEPKECGSGVGHLPETDARRPLLRTAATGEVGRDDGGSQAKRLRRARVRLKQIDNAQGGRAAYPLAVQYLRREINPILTGKSIHPIDTDLLGAAAEFTLDVGWSAYDAGEHGVARQLMNEGLRLAHTTDDRLLTARVLAAMSHQALHLDQRQAAVDLARAAITAAGRTPPATAVVMLAAMLAMTLASVGDAQEAGVVMAGAERALQGADQDEALPDWMDFDEGGLRGHAARMFQYLGRSEESERYAKLSINACRSDHERTRAQRLALLAHSLLGQGDIDQLEHVGNQLVASAWLLHSRHVDDDVAALAHAVRVRDAPELAFLLNSTGEYLSIHQNKNKNIAAQVAQWARSGSTSGYDLKCLGQPAHRKISGGGVLGDPVTQRLRDAARVCDLAGVRLDCPNLAVKRIRDVDVVVHLRAVEQPELLYRPGVQTFVVQQPGQRVGIARVRVDGSSRVRTRCQVVRMTAAETVPVPLRAPGHHPIWAGASDLPHQVDVKRRTRCRQGSFRPAEVPDLLDTKDLGGPVLLNATGTVLAARWQAGLAVGQHEVGDRHPCGSPGRDRASRPELRIIGVGDDHQSTGELHASHRTERATAATNRRSGTRTCLLGTGLMAGVPDFSDREVGRCGG